MPYPVSVTLSRTYRPGRAGGHAATESGSMVTLPVSIVSVPPSGMASRALTARFTSTSSICPGSASTGHRSAAGRGDQLDVGAERAAQHLLHRADHVVEVQHLRLDHLAAGEGEQLVGQRGGPLGGPLDLPDVLADRRPRLGAGRRGQAVQLLGDERRVVEHHREQVVEVVGHPAGQLLQVVQALALVQVGVEHLAGPTRPRPCIADTVWRPRASSTWVTAVAPTTSPVTSTTGDIVSDTATAMPSRHMRTVGRCSTYPPSAIWARSSDSPIMRSGGMSTSTGQPTISSAVYP